MLLAADAAFIVCTSSVLLSGTTKDCKEGDHNIHVLNTEGRFSAESDDDERVISSLLLNFSGTKDKFQLKLRRREDYPLSSSRSLLCYTRVNSNVPVINMD